MSDYFLLNYQLLVFTSGGKGSLPSLEDNYWKVLTFFSCSIVPSVFIFPEEDFILALQMWRQFISFVTPLITITKDHLPAMRLDFSPSWSSKSFGSFAV